MRPQDIGLNHVDRILDDQFDAHSGRQVDDHIALADQPVHHHLVRNRINSKTEERMMSQVFDVLKPPCGQVVDHRHMTPPFQEFVRQVRTDEPSSSRNQIAFRLRIRRNHFAP